MLDSSLSIGEAAKYLDVSVNTLRKWDETGKLSSINRESEKEHRRYLLSDLNKLRKVDTSNNSICIRSVKLSKLQEVFGNIAEGFNKDDLVTFTAIKNELYNGMTLMLEKEDKINCFSVEG